jgi:hypothetical protein
MTGLTRKRWYFFIWDEHNEDHLALHKIQSWEAEEVFFNKYVNTPKKTAWTRTLHDRWQNECRAKTKIGI